MEEPPESDHPTLEQAPPPELLAALRKADGETRRLPALAIPAREELVTVDDGWFALDDE